jgi:predicted phage terminase large subunit-like protein
MEETTRIAAQPGPQSEFLASQADICIYGGSAGSGKSFALLLEPLRHVENGKFAGVLFRRNSVQVRNPGGLLDESRSLYHQVGGQLKDIAMEWNFTSGMKIKFSHLELESTVHEWQGSQVPYIGFDELTHFTPSQFWYMLSRNRSVSGVPGYIRATCNPDADSWVKSLISWWLDPVSGYPLKERSGVIRWFIRQGDTMVWADTKEELIDQYGPETIPKSLTFIPAKLSDNQILMQKDPSYKANLLALPRVERARLLDGNWNARLSAGNYFHREMFQILPRHTNLDIRRQIRAWDRASTKPHEGNKDPDWTRGLKLAETTTGMYVVMDLVSLRDTPMMNNLTIRQTADSDGHVCSIGLEQDPGSAGANDIANMTKLLAGYHTVISKPSKNKELRATPVSSQCEAGNIFLLDGPYIQEMLNELEAFPTDGVHDDIVDALSTAFSLLALAPENQPGILEVLEDTHTAQYQLANRWGIRLPN